jgi:hypothetical protein
MTGRICKGILRALLIISLCFLAAIAAQAAPQRVALPSDSTLWYKSLAIAQTQVGVREATGRNDGPQVRAYLRSVGLGVGNPYCQAAQYWAFAEASKQLSLPPQAIPILKTGSTQAAWHNAVRRGRKTELLPLRGDLITWWTKGTSFGHVERVVRVMSGGWVQTVAFNTSSGSRGSQRDGGGVYLRYRNWVTPDMRMLVRGFTGFYNKPWSAK